MKYLNCFLLILFIIALVGCKSSTPPIIRIEDASQKIGTLGPLRFKFNSPSEPALIIDQLKIKPHTDLDYLIKEGILEVRPKTFFLPDVQYEISLPSVGLESKENSLQKNFSWKFITQPRCLLYIGSVNENPEIWKYCLDQQVKMQLSHTQGHIAAYDPSADGRWIAYSVYNAEGGADIWLMDRDGKNNRMIFSCGKDDCIDLQFVADDEDIVFIKLNKNLEKGKSGFEINLVNRSQLTATNIFSGENLDPILFEPDSTGSKITFFDKRSSSIWIFGIETKTLTKLPAGEGLGGNWNRMDDTFIFSRMVYWGGIPYGELVNYDLVSGEETVFFGSEKEPNEYFNPQWRPQHDYMAISYRPVEGSASKQILLISQDGKQKIEISNNQSYSYGNFTWSTDGQFLAYQRIQMGKSNAAPEIGIWSYKSQLFSIINTEAAMPKWLP